MSRFAENTTVPADKSRAEIERTLQRYGADQFAYGWETNRAMIQFRVDDRLVRFVLPLPDRADPLFTRTPTKGDVRSPEAAERAWEQATRQKWRALLLMVKAMLEAVESGIVAFEDVFLAQTVLPDNSTVADFMHPQIEVAARTGQMPHAMPALEAGS